MRQNQDIDQMSAAQLVEKALRFYAKHEYLHDDQKKRIENLADYISVNIQTDLRSIF